jgi:hypothetical protein
MSVGLNLQSMGGVGREGDGSSFDEERLPLLQRDLAVQPADRAEPNRGFLMMWDDAGSQRPRWTFAMAHGEMVGLTRGPIDL